jgi:hypothetical protein
MRPPLRSTTLTLLAALLALAPPLAPSAAAPDTTRVKALVAHDTMDLDSIARDRGAPQYSKRAQARIRARTDSILAAIRVRAETTIVVDTTQHPDTTVVVDTTTPPPPPPAPAPDTAGVVALAALPLSEPSAAYPTGLTTVPVVAGASLQAAIDNAPCNAELELAAGATYTGNFTWRVRPCSTPLAIRTAGPIPPRGTRVTPALSATWKQAKIVTPNNLGAITTAPGASGYYLENVEVSCPVNLTNGCITLGTTQTTLAQVPSRIVLSHVYVHGAPTMYLRRCVSLQSASTAIVDSWAGECHENNTDSQAILGYNGPGPYLIENNYLEAGHEVIMFGGADPSIQGLIPSDITIRRNHITRPVAWKGVWKVKNLIETKNARRMLIEGNVIENTWADAQTGYAILPKSVNQSGGCPWCVSRDITIRRNLIRNVGAGLNLAAAPQGTVEHADHVTVYHNIWLNVYVAPGNGEAREYLLLSDLGDIAITHNTTTGTGIATAISFDGQPPKITRLMFASNIYDNGAYGIHGVGGGVSTLASAVDTSQMRWTYNVATGPACSASALPALNRCASSTSVVGLDVTGALSPGSAFALPSHDGRPIGANAAAVYAAVAGVVVADPSRLAARRAPTAAQTGWRRTDPAAAKRDADGAGSPVQ